MNARARRFPLFDSLRAIAAIAVLCLHAAGPSGADAAGTLAQPFVVRLNVGVTIFFIISGFLLYRPFVRARLLGRPRPDLASYALGRVLRIAPAYWLALMAIGLLDLKPEVFGHRWWAYYGFAQIYTTAPLSGLGPAWSLCVELAFYAFLPLYALALALTPARSRRELLRSELAGLAVLAAVALGYQGLVAGGDVPRGNPLVNAPIGYLDWFALGMLLAVVSVWADMRDREPPRWLRSVERFPGAAWGFAGAVFIATALYFDGRTVYSFTVAENYLEHISYGLIAFAIVLPFTFGDQRQGRLRRTLDNRVLLYLGLVSYGVFLWHQAVLLQLQAWHFDRVTFIHPYVLWTVTTLILATAIATLSYYVVERPAMSLRRRIRGARAGRPRDEATAEPSPATPLAARDAG